MKRGVLIIIAVVFLVIFGVVVLLLSRASSKKVVANPVLKVWAPFDEKKVYDEMAQSFIAANPTVTFEFEYIKADDSKDYEAKVVDAIASGKGPDVWLIRTDWLPKHATKLAAMPDTLGWSTSRRIKESDALDTLFSKPVIAQNSFEGKLYGLPLGVDSLALYINDAAVDAAQEDLEEASDPRADILSQDYPKTLSQLEQWSQAITKKTKSGIVRTGLALGTTTNTYAAVDVYTALLQLYPGALYTPAKEVGLHLALENGSVPATDALNFFSSFSSPGSANYSWNSNLGDPVKKFASGEVAMMIAYSSLQTELLRINNDIRGISVVPLPQLKLLALPADERTDFAAYWTHVVPRSSQNQQLAWYFIKSLAQESVRSLYEEKTLKPSVLLEPPSDTRDLGSVAFGNLDLFGKQIINAPVAYKPDWQFTDAVIRNMIKAVNDGALGVQAAVDTTAQALKLGRQ